MGRKRTHQRDRWSAHRRWPWTCASPRRTCDRGVAGGERAAWRQRVIDALFVRHWASSSRLPRFASSTRPSAGPTAIPTTRPSAAHAATSRQAPLATPIRSDSRACL
ncbi:hypothetical protein FA95DRAFT_1309657 [Auriscalpium vulgare]|uniref:Uncharacterized protein n=1 Tax=Auriscalpium vulgare TaxID=40419 RepID=A0ACB8R1N8_9AGAM|nr:hypothetical protein FA95DRAFT_1309657 [Auriscalpium vulgare]